MDASLQQKTADKSDTPTFVSGVTRTVDKYAHITYCLSERQSRHSDAMFINNLMKMNKKKVNNNIILTYLKDLASLTFLHPECFNEEESAFYSNFMLTKQVAESKNVLSNKKLRPKMDPVIMLYPALTTKDFGTYVNLLKKYFDIYDGASNKEVIRAMYVMILGWKMYHTSAPVQSNIARALEATVKALSDIIPIWDIEILENDVNNFLISDSPKNKGIIKPLLAYISCKGNVKAVYDFFESKENKLDKADEVSLALLLDCEHYI